MVRAGLTLLLLLNVLDSTAFSQQRRAYDWRAHMLDLHNSTRYRLGLPPLAWSEDLARSSRDWAVALVQSGEFRHDGDHRHGQNLFAITNGRTTVSFVYGSWASEAQSYDHTRNSCSDVCGHYTQIIWRETRYIGCALARNTQREVWVCDYSPPGNVVGERPY